jgi:hypothetical protein
VSYVTLLWLSKKCTLWRRRVSITVRFVAGDPVTHKSQPSPGLAAGAFSLLAVVGGAEAQALFCLRRHQPRRPTRAINFAWRLFWVTIASAKSARNAGSTGFLLSGVTLSRFSAPAFFLARRGQRSGISRQGRSFGGDSVHLLMEALISFLLTAGDDI